MVQDLYRLAYASRSTFKPFVSASGMDVNIAQILEVARQNNQKNHLVGALYYGNGCFFQCLEGSKQAIDDLYTKLLKDPRHENLKILAYDAIEEAHFSSWEMKFATIDHEVRSFLREHNIHKFDPYQFTPEMTKKLVFMLQDADDGAHDDVVVQTAKVPMVKQSAMSQWGAVLGGVLVFAMGFALFGY